METVERLGIADLCFFAGQIEDQTDRQTGFLLNSFPIFFTMKGVFGAAGLLSLLCQNALAVDLNMNDDSECFICCMCPDELLG